MHHTLEALAIAERLAADLEAAFGRPWEACAAVPAWQYARILHDPNGIMAGLQATARAWTWEAIATAEGPAWAPAWDTATGITPSDHQSGCRAALALYRIAADRLIDHLDGSDRAIVTTARGLAADH